jgi:hypothetical protein
MAPWGEADLSVQSSPLTASNLSVYILAIGDLDVDKKCSISPDGVA